jgi:hypothetical protein
VGGAADLCKILIVHNLINIYKIKLMTDIISQKVISNELLEFIKHKLTDEEHALFAESFYLYLQYDSEKDFVIDLDTIYEWLGFKRKDNAKRLLTSKFIMDTDYIINEMNPPIGGFKKGGKTEQQILMNIKTFKKFCMKADTKRADIILDYYIKIESCQQDFLLHSLQETHLELKQKDEQIKLLEKPPYYDVNKTQFVYIFQEISKKGQNIYKVGLAKTNVDKRKKSYKTYSSDGVEECFRFQTHNCYIVENITKQLLFKFQYGNESSQGGTEYFKCNLEYIKNIIKTVGSIIDTLFGTHDNISIPQIIKHLNNNLIHNLLGEDYIQTFLPEIILQSCQNTFDSNNKHIKKKFKKLINKSQINNISDNIQNDFNSAIELILHDFKLS